MCWACDHPEASLQDYLGHLRSVVSREGWAVQGLQRDQRCPPWAYTVGLTQFGRPELVVTGMPVARAAGLLNDVAAHAMHAAPPDPGEEVQLAGGPLIRVVQVAVPAAYLGMAVALYGAEVRALQIVHADDRGHWPWDRGYRGIRGGQPVLGEPAVAGPGIDQRG